MAIRGYSPAHRSACGKAVEVVSASAGFIGWKCEKKLILNMPQDIETTYRWETYEKMLLGAASALVWLPVVWALFLPDIMDILDGIMNLFSITEDSPFRGTVFLGYVMAWLISHVFVFGGLAYIFPRICILPVWGLNFWGGYLRVKQVIISIIDPFDPNSLNYSGRAADYHSFSLQNIFLAFLTVSLGVILARPALFYARFVSRKLFSLRRRFDGREHFKICHITGQSKKS